MSTALVQIIANDKLTGDNYIKWKHNINAILVTKDLKFVLTEECPPTPTANAHELFVRHMRNGSHQMRKPKHIC